MHVAILGCGYVGIALGQQLRAAGHDVVGVRRSEAGLEAIRAAGLRAVRGDVTEPRTLDAVPAVDGIVFAASSGGRDADAARSIYIDGLRTVISHFTARSNPPTRLVYTSSTGVYGDHDGGWVDETSVPTPSTEKTEVLLEAERIARDATPETLRASVVRFAGLYGPDRYRLERYLDGPVVEGYLNMIHRRDAAGAIKHLLELADPPELVLAADNEPVDRWVFADWLAAACDQPRPEKETIPERLLRDTLSAAQERRLRTNKRCANDRLRGLGYDFVYPTFREGYQPAIEQYRSQG